MFIRIWEFRTGPGKATEFLAVYGSRGAWADLFRRGAGYLGTELLESTSDPAVFITADRWESAEAWQAFLKVWSADYAALDQSCEGLTAAESEIGAYREVSSA
jgi:heme-degrading monooxygenase HmoA